MVSVSCFGVRVSVMFHFMFVHYTFSSVWGAEWPHFGKQLSARLAICSHCILPICNTGELRYLEFQGNGENTSQIMMSREFMYMNKNVLTSVSNFRKIGIATKRLYACNPLCTTRTFYPQISGSDYG